MAKGSKKKGRSRHGGGPKTTNHAAHHGSNATSKVTVDVSEEQSEAQGEQKEIPTRLAAEEDPQTEENVSMNEAPHECTVPAASPPDDVAAIQDSKTVLNEQHQEELDVVKQEMVLEWKRCYEEASAALEEAKETADVANRAKEKAEQECIAERERQSLLHQQLKEAAEVQESMAVRVKEWDEVRDALLEEVSVLKGQLSKVEAECEKAQQSETTAIQDAASARDELQKMLKMQNDLIIRCETLEVVQQKCKKLQQEKDMLQSDLEEAKDLAVSRLTELENVRHNEAALQSQKTKLEEESHQNQAFFESELEAAQKLHQDQEDELRKLKEMLTAKEAECRQIEEEKENMACALKERVEAENVHQSEQESLRNKLKAAIRKGKRIEDEKHALEVQHSELNAHAEGLSSQLSDLTSQIRMWEEKQQLSEEQRAELEEQLAKERGLAEERQVALTQVEGDFATFKTEWQIRMDEMEDMKKEAVEKESGIRLKLQSAVKKGKRIESERQRLEEQIAEMGKVVAEMIEKVPEISVLKQQVVQLSAELASMELQFQNCVTEGARHRSEVLQLTKEVETLRMGCSKAEAAQKLLQTQLQEELDRNARADMALEEASQKICDFEKEKLDMEDHRVQLEDIISGNETKLVRAREAIETLRKERSLLSEQHAAFEQEVQSLRSENEAIMQQQDSSEEMELQNKISEIEKAHRLVEKRLSETTDQLVVTQEAKQKLEAQLMVLQDELQSSSNPPDHSADLQVIETLYQTATSVAQQLNLPFMETASLNNGDMANAQLQAVQVLLEGTGVGIKKTQEQLAQLPAVIGELESSKSTIRHLEEELLSLKKEAVTPASSSTVDIPTTSLSTPPYSQTKGIKRRELQEPTMTESHVIDLSNSAIDDETESKTGEYTPLISIQALRSAPPPVLHFMQSLDRQTQGAGRLLGHQPVARVGVLAYAVALHVLLFILMV